MRSDPTVPPRCSTTSAPCTTDPPYLSGLTAEDLDRVIDEAWDPPVTLGVRLVSVADDCLQHAGQAAYIRGLVTALNARNRRGPQATPVRSWGCSSVSRR